MSVKFKLGENVIEYGDWTKHHKKIPILIKSEYSNGNVTWYYKNNEELEKFNDKFITNHEKVFYEVGNKIEVDNVKNFYLSIKNADYKGNRLNNYTPCASNTKQEIFIKLKFLIEDDVLYLDYNYKTSGNYATSFYDMNNVEDIIENILEKGLSIEDVGIQDLGDGMYKVNVVNPKSGPSQYEIEKDDLLKYFVGIEMYNYEMDYIDEK
ncbi:hypothetical protein Bp8pS_086 [Bacillus phage vB_BpuM-BpSp]|nr:hypothetical protein Bp8pS_086 [Bacillus phage vB_BpuM-BpSp]